MPIQFPPTLPKQQAQAPDTRSRPETTSTSAAGARGKEAPTPPPAEARAQDSHATTSGTAFRVQDRPRRDVDRDVDALMRRNGLDSKANPSLVEVARLLTRMKARGTTKDHWRDASEAMTSATQAHATAMLSAREGDLRNKLAPHFPDEGSLNRVVGILAEEVGKVSAFEVREVSSDASANALRRVHDGFAPRRADAVPVSFLEFTRPFASTFREATEASLGSALRYWASFSVVVAELFPKPPSESLKRLASEYGTDLQARLASLLEAESKGIEGRARAALASLEGKGASPEARTEAHERLLTDEKASLTKKVATEVHDWLIGKDADAARLVPRDGAAPDVLQAHVQSVFDRASVAHEGVVKNLPRLLEAISPEQLAVARLPEATHDVDPLARAAKNALSLLHGLAERLEDRDVGPAKGRETAAKLFASGWVPPGSAAEVLAARETPRALEGALAQIKARQEKRSAGEVNTKMLNSLLRSATAGRSGPVVDVLLRNANRATLEAFLGEASKLPASTNAGIEAGRAALIASVRERLNG